MDRSRLSELLSEAVTRIDRLPLPARVAEEIRRLILLGNLPAGSSITEREMAASLGISRTPLREALRTLANEGLVDITPNRGFRVANPSIQEIHQLLEVQGVLEGLAGEIDCAVATDDQLQEVVALHQEMERISATSDPLDFFNLDMTFHRLIVQISGNAPLIGTHTTYNARLYRARFISSRRPNGRPTTLAQHAEIAAALTVRDVDRARAAFRSHLRSTGLNIAAARVESSNTAVEVVRA